MNIFEMLSFDFQEFVTSPAGILIIAGIICLLVGIIFLNGSKKATKTVEEVKEEAKPVEAQPVATEEKTPEVAPVIESIPEVQPVVVKATEDGVNEVPVPTVTDTLNIANEAPVVQPAEEIKVESLDAPVEQVTVAPTIEAPVVEAPVVEPVAAQPTVYGGTSPEVGNVVVEEKPREIYGGANPLENTAPIPTVAEVQPAPAPVAFEAAPAPVAPAPVVQPSFEPAPAVPAPEVAAPAPAPVAPVIEPPKEEIEKLEF